MNKTIAWYSFGMIAIILVAALQFGFISNTLGHSDEYSELMNRVETLETVKGQPQSELKNIWEGFSEPYIIATVLAGELSHYSSTTGHTFNAHCTNDKTINGFIPGMFGINVIIIDKDVVDKNGYQRYELTSNQIVKVPLSRVSGFLTGCQRWRRWMGDIKAQPDNTRDLVRSKDGWYTTSLTGK